MALTKTLGGKRRQYDGRKLWEVYHSMGRAASYAKLNTWARNNGMANPETGDVKGMGPNWAMWAYAMDNPEKAFPAYKAWALEHQTELLSFGIEPSEENLWRKFLEDVKDHNSKGKPTYSKKRFNRFCEKYNLPYQEEESPLLDKVPV